MLFLFSCGGGDGGMAGVSGTISGTALKGPVSGAVVTAYAINSNGSMGAQIAVEPLMHKAISLFPSVHTQGLRCCD